MREDILRFLPHDPNLAASIIGLTITEGGTGITCEQSSPSIEHCTIIDNAASNGGGLYCSENSAPVVSRCRISWNEASQGGGGLYYVASASPTLANCVITNNTANIGAGLYSLDSAPTLNNCTLTENSALEDAGALFGQGSNPTFTNCILWADTPNELSAGAPILAYSNIQGGWPGEGNIDADPGFRTHGRFDYLLRPGSPCIDTGDPTLTDSLSDRHPRWPDRYANGTRSDIGIIAQVEAGDIDRRTPTKVELHPQHCGRCVVPCHHELVDRKIDPGGRHQRSDRSPEMALSISHHRHQGVDLGQKQIEALPSPLLHVDPCVLFLGESPSLERLQAALAGEGSIE